MTSWNWTAQLLLFVFFSKIEVSYGGCVDLFNVTKWGGNLIQVFPLVDTRNPEDQAECTWEREYVLQKNDEAGYMLRDCFGRKIDHNRRGNISEKCKGETSGTIPYYYLMCSTITAFKHKTGEKFEAKQCDHDTECKPRSGEPSTATPTTLPERTEVTPTTTTTELPPTTTNFTQINATPTTLPERTVVTSTSMTTTELPPTSTNFSQINATPTTLSERTVVTSMSMTTTELPPTTTNFTQINGLNRSTTLPLTTTQPEETTSANRLVPPTMTTTEISPRNDQRIATEKENVTLKIMLVISALFNVAALMMILYRCKPNQGSSHEPVATDMSDGASLEAQPMTELQLCTAGPFVNRRTVESTCLIENPEPNSTFALPPNCCQVGNEE